ASAGSSEGHRGMPGLGEKMHNTPRHPPHDGNASLAGWRGHRGYRTLARPRKVETTHGLSDKRIHEALRISRYGTHALAAGLRPVAVRLSRARRSPYVRQSR